MDHCWKEKGPPQAGGLELHVNERAYANAPPTMIFRIRSQAIHARCCWSASADPGVTAGAEHLPVLLAVDGVEVGPNSG